MARILRGEIRWANLNPTIGHEQSGNLPVLILSTDIFQSKLGNSYCGCSNKPGTEGRFSLTLAIEKANLPKRSWVKISQIRTLSVERIGGRFQKFQRNSFTSDRRA